MQRSYLSNKTIDLQHHIKQQFYVRPGDVLLHDSNNGNKLVVYRGGQILKILTAARFGLDAMVRIGWLQDTTGKNSKMPSPAASGTPAPLSSDVPYEASSAVPVPISDVACEEVPLHSRESESLPPVGTGDESYPADPEVSDVLPAAETPSTGRRKKSKTEDRPLASF